MKMDSEDYIDILSARAADARAIIMFFAVFHTGLLVVLGFAGTGFARLGNSTCVNSCHDPYFALDVVLP